MGTAVGETIEKTIILSEDDIIDFAMRIQDMNPLHHDLDYAAETRFGGIIASGPHISAIFLAMGPTHFSQYGPVLGLNFNVAFRAAVFPNRTLHMKWQVTDVEESDSMGGEVITLSGTVKDESGTILLTGEGQLLIKDEG